MQKTSTSFTQSDNTTAATAEADHGNAGDPIPAGSPRKSTIDRIRQFARACHFDSACLAAPVVVMLN